MRHIAARSARDARGFSAFRTLLRRFPPRPSRPFLLLLLLPFVIAGGASGGYYFRLHHMTQASTLAGLPLAAAPAGARRILVLSPHCDDETLGVGGMIADARRAGAAVTVAFLTNGDGFPVAAGRALGEVHLSPADYVRFAERRQNESLSALTELGVPSDHVLFLGYPDRGLEAMWESNWDAAHPFRSSYTGHIRSPYARAYTHAAPYCGAALLADLTRLLKTTRPTDIYVTHPSDDHPDHSIAAAFTQAALRAVQDSSDSWARAVRLRYYIVHRGDWPLPQGVHPEDPLTPPTGLRDLDTRWEVYKLSVATCAAKKRALEKYRSQIAVTRRFLTSFLRTNELYGTLPELPVPVHEDVVWESAPDPTRDDVVRYVGPSADLNGISIRREDDALHVRVRTRGPISPRVRYTLLLRIAGRDGTRFVALNLPLPPKSGVGGFSKDGIRVTAEPKALEAAVPWDRLGASPNTAEHLWVAAETQWARMPVDRTGYRAFDLNGAQTKNNETSTAAMRPDSAAGGRPAPEATAWNNSRVSQEPQTLRASGAPRGRGWPSGDRSSRGAPVSEKP